MVFVLIAILAPLLAPYDPITQSMARINRPPSWQNWLGTDQFGRDVLSRIIYGSRNSLLFGLFSPFFAAIIGTSARRHRRLFRRHHRPGDLAR